MVKKGKDFGKGMRRLYKDMLDETRMTYPRYKEIHKETRNGRSTPVPLRLRHPIKWYIDGHLVNRPVYGVYALATFAEYLLHQAKFGHRGRRAALHEVMAFYAETRRTMRDMLTGCGIDNRLPPQMLNRMRERTRELIESAKMSLEAIERTKKHCLCPVCKGHPMSANDSELLVAILYECSSKGMIPPESSLYREITVDMLPEEVV